LRIRRDRLYVCKNKQSVPLYSIEAIKIRMEELDLKQKDLIGIIGGKSRVSEILNKRKKLTVEMVRNLAKRLNLSVQILISDYPLLK
jgi:HTH-type transcriptional regulator/antitoxin HigA